LYIGVNDYKNLWMILPIFEEAWGDSGYFFKGYTEEYLKKVES
jgi:hypothetical protein